MADNGTGTVMLPPANTGGVRPHRVRQGGAHARQGVRPCGPRRDVCRARRVVHADGAIGCLARALDYSLILGGLAFCLGLFLVLVAGAELFTGNCLMVIGALDGSTRSFAWCANRRSSTRATPWAPCWSRSFCSHRGSRGCRMARWGSSRAPLVIQGGAEPSCGLLARHPVQRSRVPRRVDGQRRQDGVRQARGRYPAGCRVRRAGVRALRGEHVLPAARHGDRGHVGSIVHRALGVFPTCCSSRSATSWAVWPWQPLIGSSTAAMAAIRRIP